MKIENEIIDYGECLNKLIILKIELLDCCKRISMIFKGFSDYGYSHFDECSYFIRCYLRSIADSKNEIYRILKQLELIDLSAIKEDLVKVYDCEKA